MHPPKANTVLYRPFESANPQTRHGPPPLCLTCKLSSNISKRNNNPGFYQNTYGGTWTKDRNEIKAFSRIRVRHLTAIGLVSHLTGLYKFFDILANIVESGIDNQGTESGHFSPAVTSAKNHTFNEDNNFAHWPSKLRLS